MAKTKEEIREYHREYLKKNKARLRAKRLEWEASNAEHKREYDKEYRASRKEQIAEYNKKYREENKEVILAKSKEKWERNGEKYREQKRQYRKENKERISEERRKHRKEHPEVYKARYQKSKDESMARCKEYQKRRKSIDPLYAFKEKVRSNINQILMRKGVKKNCRTYQILGCSLEEFTAYIEEQFMNMYGVSMFDIDEPLELHHRIPIHTAKSEEEVLRLNHHSNLVLLTKIDHRNLHKEMS